MATKPEVGTKAPIFELDTDTGGRISSADLIGKKAVVYFYPKDDTSGCTKQAIEFSALEDQFDRLGTRIVGISADSPQKHDKFKAKHNLTITLASDGQHQTLQAYGVWVEKTMYGRKFMGIERSTFLINEDGIISSVWRNVRVPGHVDAVLAAVKSPK